MSILASRLNKIAYRIMEGRLLLIPVCHNSAFTERKENVNNHPNDCIDTGKSEGPIQLGSCYTFLIHVSCKTREKDTPGPVPSRDRLKGKRGNLTCTTRGCKGGFPTAFLCCFLFGPDLKLPPATRSLCKVLVYSTKFTLNYCAR